MNETLRKFLRPRLAVVLAAALLAASLPAGVLPSAYAVDIGLVPAPTWEDAVSGEFTAAGTALTSYTYYGSDGSEETVTVDHSKDLGAKENPISIPDEASLIRFGKLRDTADKYYILDKSGGVYDMQGDTRSMLPLMGTCQSGGTPDMPSGNLSFQGTLIGNGAKIQNACIKAPNGNWTHPGLFGCLKSAEVMDLTVFLTFAEQNNGRCYAGGIAAAARGNNSLQRLTVDLTVTEGSVYDSAGGLMGGIGYESTATMTGCSATVTGDLDGWCAGGLIGEVSSNSTATMTGCSANVTGNLNGRSAVGGLVGNADSESTVTLASCSANVTGTLEGDCGGGLMGNAYLVNADSCTATVEGGLKGLFTGGLVGLFWSMTLTDCTATVSGDLVAGEDGAAGSLAGGGSNNMTMTGCTAEIGGNLTTGKGGVIGGLAGGGSNMTMTGCTATVTGSLTAADEGGAAGGLVGTAVNRGGVLMGALQEEDAAGGPAQSGSAAMNLTNCSVKVDGDLTAGDVGISGGLVGIAIDYDNVPSSAMQEEDAAGGLARSGSDVTMSLANCSTQVGGGLKAGAPGVSGGLLGCAASSTVTLTDCSAQVTGGLTAAAHEQSASGGLVGAADSGTVTLTNCSAQTVITESSPSGPVGMGDECVTFTGANVTTLQMGVGSQVSLALVNGTALTLTDTDGLTATGEAANSDNSVTGSVTVKRDGSAGIQVHGGDATYTLTGVNGTIRLEDKTGDTPAEYWVTLNADFTTAGPDPLTKGDAVDLLGEAGNRSHTVTVEAGAGGTVSGGGTVARNQQTTVTATPDSGYRFAGWTENGRQVSTDANYTFSVTGSRSLTAVFERSSSGGSSGGSTPTYTPDVPQPSEGGGAAEVVPSNPKQGDTVTVTPKPDEGYKVEEITVTDKNGKPVEVTKKPDGTYTFQQPDGKVKIEVTYQPVNTSWNAPFTDVSEGDWYYEAVRFVQESGLMNGFEDGRFGPGDDLSRSQLAQILFNKEGRPAVSGGGFNDVDSSAWYAGAVIWAAENGIVGGYGNGTFGPNDPITREQLAVMLWRYSGSPAATDQELHFNDTDEISGFALEAMRWAVENGILNGYGDGKLGPQGQAARAQVAQMLKNFMENQEEDL